MKTIALSSLLTTFAPASPLDDTGILLHQAPNLFSLWEALETEREIPCPPPFWGIVWPGNRLLAAYLLSHARAIQGKTVLDLGCGCGAAAVAAAFCGAAAVCANDIDRDALTVALCNAALNGVCITTDHTDYLVTPPSRHYDFVLVADMFYEATATTPLLHILHAQQHAGATVLVADGNRPFTPRNQFTLLTSATLDVNAEVEGVDKRNVDLYQLAP